MDQSTYDSLTARERDCLRLVAQGLTSKQMQPMLEISAGRVDDLLKSACRKLDAPTRKDAARLLADHEQTPPQWLGPQPTGVPGVPETEPVRTPPPDRDWRNLIPIRRPGDTRNRMPTMARLLWIPLLAFAGAVGFGMLSVGIKTGADLIGSRPLLQH